jgi:glucan phosphoethanolaminetransferase (alkaline phosphatase superfamily)
MLYQILFIILLVWFVFAIVCLIWDMELDKTTVIRKSTAKDCLIIVLLGPIAFLIFLFATLSASRDYNRERKKAKTETTT